MTTTRMLAAVTSLALAGCVSVSAAPEKPTLDGASAARAVVLCKTTLAELTKRLGPPSRDGMLHRDHIVSWVAEWGDLSRYLAVQVDADGVVTDLYWDVPTEVPWVPQSQCPPKP